MQTRIAPLVASVAVLGLAAGAASARADTIDFAHQIRSEQTFTLRSNTTKTYNLPIAGLGQADNALEPCEGFEINGPGVKIAASGLSPIGLVDAEHPDQPDGGVPGAVRQPDGTFVMPASTAKLIAWSFTFGARCAAADWSFFDTAGHDQVDGTTGAPGLSAAAARAAGRRAARAAQAGGGSPITVKLAALKRGPTDADTTVTVEVTTGRLTGRTTLTEHATVLPQVADPS